MDTRTGDPATVSTTAGSMMLDDADWEGTDQDENVIPLSMLGSGLWLTMKIVLPLMLGAIVVFVAWFNFSVIAALIAAFVAFILMIFIAIPLWLSIAEDELLDKEHVDH